VEVIPFLLFFSVVITVGTLELLFISILSGAGGVTMRLVEAVVVFCSDVVFC